MGIITKLTGLYLKIIFENLAPGLSRDQPGNTKTDFGEKANSKRCY